MSTRFKQGVGKPTYDWWCFPAGAGATLINFSSGYTFSLKIGFVGSAALLTKTTGITGAAGSGDGSQFGDVPNVSVAWAAGEIALTPGRYAAELTATTGGLSRIFSDTFEIDGVIS